MVHTLKTFENFIPERDTYAVFGNPIRHSLSPQLHKSLGKFSNNNFDYIAVEIAEDEFPAALDIAKEKLCGFNLTMPFKQLILPYLSHCDDEVLRTGSANTVKVVNGEFYGFTTDGLGLCAALKMKIDTLAGRNVLILGAGGTARSVAGQLAQNGASVTVAVRDANKGKAFVSDLEEKTKLNSFSYTSFSSVPDKFDILVNTTPVGMNSIGVSPIDLSQFKNLKLVYDCIYSPPMTELLLQAKSLNIPFDNGISMLILQGAFSETHWFGLDFSDSVIKTVIENIKIEQIKRRLSEVHNKKNIALCGFMGSGKTTIGKKIASLLNMDFIDLDELIELQQGMKIKEIFAKYGEEYFRSLETDACKSLSSIENTVISLGGGCVLFNNNDKIVKENAYLIFLNRTFEEIEENLQGSTNRPLLDRNNVFDLFTERQPKYLACADTAVSFENGNIDTAAYSVLSFI